MKNVTWPGPLLGSGLFLILQEIHDKKYYKKDPYSMRNVDFKKEKNAQKD
jgi:hypothetical protein